jgi:5-methylcytosine-specific restriction endonuclease McrA
VPDEHQHIISYKHWFDGSRCPYCSGYFKWTKDYKEEIKERDNYQCLNPYCFHNDNVLSVHHIDYTKTICGPDNLITLCRSCNSRANFDRKWHTQWYRIILNKRYNYTY